MRAIAVDDDVRMHSVLEKMLIHIGSDVIIIDNAYNVEEAVDLITTHEPELLFLDIDLPDGTGFDVLERIDPSKYFFIFITGHNDQARRALEFNALHYLVKPLKAIKLKEALRRMEERILPQRAAKQLGKDIGSAKESLFSSSLPEHLKIQNADGFFPLFIEDIILLGSANGYVTVVMKGGRKVRKYASLSTYVNWFEDYPDFEQIHQSFLINVKHLSHIGKGPVVVMVNQETIPVSPAIAKKLRSRFE